MDATGRYPDEKVSVTPFTGPETHIPLADVTMTVYGETLRMRVAVQEDLGYDALLGLDVPTFER